MKINKFGIIMSDTTRSRAYIQFLLRNKLIPSDVIILDSKKNEKGKLGQYNGENINNKIGLSDFYPNLSIFESLDKESIPYRLVKEDSINHEDAISVINDSKIKYFIYSGFGGIILKKNVLNIGKEFIHVHGGLLPFYRGSTCNYYSIINENYIGASSIIMNEEIDRGPILISKKFEVPKEKLIIDHYYDPLVRSQVLVETIRLLLNDGINIKPNKKTIGDIFYVIHPVLKHISILK